MFGWRRQVEALQAQVEVLTQRVDRLGEQTAAVRPVLDETERLEELAARMEGLRSAAEVALGALEARSEVARVGRPRFQPEFNTVYRAETPGYVWCHFTTGRTGTIRLLVGDHDPPIDCICEVSSAAGDQYASGLIRMGEYWTIECRRPGWSCVFTPLF